MKRLYMILPIIAGLMFGSIGIFVRTLTQNGIDSTTLLFLRFSIAIIPISIAILLTDKKLFKTMLKDIPLFLVCSISIVGLNLCYNTSMNSVPLSIAAVLLSTAPIFVIIFAYIIFREKITSKKIICMLIAILGCILMSGALESSANIAPIGMLAGIGAALFWAFYLIASKKSMKNSNHTYTILFYGVIFISLGLIPFTNFNQINNFISIDYIQTIIFLIVHSTFSFAMPYILSTVSLNYLDSGTSSILLSGTEPLAALIFGFLVYSEIPSILMLCGFAITIISMMAIGKTDEEKLTE